MTRDLCLPWPAKVRLHELSDETGPDRDALPRFLLGGGTDYMAAAVPATL